MIKSFYIMLFFILGIYSSMALSVDCDDYKTNYGKGIKYSTIPQACIDKAKESSLIAFSDKFNVYVESKMIVVTDKDTNKDFVITGSNAKFTSPEIVSINEDIFIYDSSLNEILTYATGKSGNLAAKRSFNIGEDDRVVNFFPIAKLDAIVVLYERGEVKFYNLLANKHGGTEVTNKKSLFDMAAKGTFKSLSFDKVKKTVTIQTDSMTYNVDLADLKKIKLDD